MTGRESREDPVVAYVSRAPPTRLPLQKLMRNSSTHSTMLRAGFARN